MKELDQAWTFLLAFHSESSSPTVANRLPRPFGRLPQSPGFHRTSGTMQLSDCSSRILSHFASRLIGAVIPVPPGNTTSPPGVTSRSSVPCRSHTPWYDGWVRTPSPPYCRLDLAPSLADRFINGVDPLDYGPVLLRKPFRFHLTMDTLPSGCLATVNQLSSSLGGARRFQLCARFGPRLSIHPGQ